ncbi:hypothetical protein ACSLVK_15115 [Photorhabdus tasmaniensis]|uniref:hypothetical protein n=1 Tax=Photorhabdus tasmaniensis TaxID=1004159 RepID=UPI00140BFF7A|nr:hypothetical protein [Photorhabdus tasmaniensis]
MPRVSVRGAKRPLMKHWNLCYSRRYALGNIKAGAVACLNRLTITESFFPVMTDAVHHKDVGIWCFCPGSPLSGGQIQYATTMRSKR